jgi:hypothetical protein
MKTLGSIAPAPSVARAERAEIACSVRRAARSGLNHIGGSRGGIAGVYQRHGAAEKRAAPDAGAAQTLAIVEGRTSTQRGGARKSRLRK